ncbi:hypothetical protein DFH06DRAFT_1151931 [Mycena polygramma]|nr:hypothetical protein DFH06DRAFT_1151931 [Mycena polygramma]
MRLDSNYDRADAGRVLDLCIEKSQELVASENDVAIQHLADIKMKVEDIVVHETGMKKKLWRFMTTNLQGEVECEVVFRTQGILASTNLILNENMTKQTLKWVGKYEDGSLHDWVTRLNKSVQEWKVTDESCDEFINASANFFSWVHDDPNAVSVKMGRGVDPVGVFIKHEGSGLVHTADNVVKYYKLISEDGRTTHSTATPGRFRVGDVVEVRGSIRVVASKNNTLKMHFHMHSMVLLDSTLSMNAENKLCALRRKSIFQHWPD